MMGRTVGPSPALWPGQDGFQSFAGTPTGSNCVRWLPVVSQEALNHRLQAVTPPGVNGSKGAHYLATT